jgi:hypothetical protein
LVNGATEAGFAARNAGLDEYPASVRSLTGIGSFHP